MNGTVDIPWNAGCRDAFCNRTCGLYGVFRIGGVLTPASGLRRFFRLFFAFWAVLVASLVLPMSTWSAAAPPEPPASVIVYVVKPGDTLEGISGRYGTTVHDLMRLNALQSPMHIYAGQSLQIHTVWTAAETSFSLLKMPWGTSLLDVSRLVRIDWERLAVANRLLLPAALLPGYELVVPGTFTSDRLVREPYASPTFAAVRRQLPAWQLRQLNPLPILTDEPVVIPAEASPYHPAFLPYPLLDVRVRSQPLIRGETAYINITTAEPVTCTIALLDQLEPCYVAFGPSSSSLQYIGLVGLSPLLDPGLYTMTLELATVPGDVVSVPLPFLVSRGRYDFERIDLPPDRTALLDPVLSQLEREKIAELRLVRTTDRYDSPPFDLPFPGSVTSFFGSRRSYGYGFTSFHAGTDFRAEVGVPVSAPAAGKVVLAEQLVVRGNAVILDHGWGVMTGYWHLSRIDVDVGQMLNRGDIIGAVGNTGLSTGPHLHWELWVNGVSVSPLVWTGAETSYAIQE